MTTSRFVFDVDERTFPEIVLGNSQRYPVLVDFWAAWCAPCRMLAPILDKLAEEFAGGFVVAKVNTDEERQLAAQYGVQSLPTVKVFRNGAVVEEFLGAQPEGAIRQLLDRHVERESDRVRAEATVLHGQGKTGEAIERLRGARAMDPANERVTLDLANMLLLGGALSEAEELLHGLPANRQPDPDVVELLTRLKFARIVATAPPTAELEDRIARDPKDYEARYGLGAGKALAGDYEAAMEHFLNIMRGSRTFREDAGRERLVDVFTLIGDKDPALVGRYRASMSSLLY
uniref:Thioredoxin n=1 Tax=Candidatus Kentrum sp. DK TaxID=2126562 RepID=A0A450T3A9_9GAMM|nr:MAG: thioredoxin [Candidatus Kentron sp. DK]